VWSSSLPSIPINFDPYIHFIIGYPAELTVDAAFHEAEVVVKGQVIGILRAIDANKSQRFVQHKLCGVELLAVL
jgi:hypothetical protein